MNFERRIDREVGQLILELFVWFGILLLVVALFACAHAEPSEWGLSYGYGIGEASADGFESEGVNQAMWFHMIWQGRAQDFRLVGHEVRDPIPILGYRTDDPPPVHIHDLGGDPSVSEQVRDIVGGVDQTSDSTKILIVSIIAIVAALSAALGAAWWVSRTRRTNSKPQEGS